jgi:hypothetical protein
MNLHKTFRAVMGAEYKTVGDGGDFCIQRDGELLRLYFEKSDGLRDWLNNFNFPAKPYRRMKGLWFCHRGFLRVWKAIEPYVAADILDPSVKQIEVAGYSHGAALALLCYEYCRYHRPDAEVQGAGFGCPRVIWGVMPERVRGFTVVRCGRDIVTHVPPALFGYRHPTKPVRIGKSNLVRDHYPDRYEMFLREERL